MKKVDNNYYINKFVDYCKKSGIREDRFLNKDNIDEYVDTVVDGYHGYPLFKCTFKNTYNEVFFHKMLAVDFKSRIGKTIGIATDNYESILLIEPPMTKKTGALQYLKTVDFSSFKLLFNNKTIRQNAFEKYAYKQRKQYVDDNTWYLYIFVTKKALQRNGYGKRLMNMFISFVKENNYKVCFETNLKDNVAMYQKFGFTLMKSLVYKKMVDHYVFIMDNNK